MSKTVQYNKGEHIIKVAIPQSIECRATASSTQDEARGLNINHPALQIKRIEIALLEIGTKGIHHSEESVFKLRGLVQRRPNSTIHQIVIFSIFLKIDVR
jgi:hypothetical protein